MKERKPRQTHPPARLDEIATDWSLLRLAHQPSVTGSGPARDALALRYNGAIRSYVGALVKEEHDADELAQEALVRILRGTFSGADPQRGRFRDLLKVAVQNLVRTYWTRKQRRTGKNIDVSNLAEADSLSDGEWTAQWQRSVLQLTWAALQAFEREHPGSIAWTLLRLRADHPDDDSTELAARLSQAIGRTIQPAAMRQQLRRARLRFAQLVVEEVARGLDDPTPERVVEELIEVGLMEYVRDFLPPDWRARGELRELAKRLS
jgi:DNA-directed RNA polymerase specialized sigma24 family protein